MATIDIIVLGIITCFSLLGAISGFVMQVSRLLAVVVGVGCALFFSDYVMSGLPQAFSEYPGLRQVVFPVAIFLIGFLSILLLGRTVSSALRKIRLGSVDRALGGLLGAVKGAIIGYFLVSLLVSAQSASGKTIPYLDPNNSYAKEIITRYPIGNYLDKERLKSLIPKGD